MMGRAERKQLFFFVVLLFLLEIIACLFIDKTFYLIFSLLVMQILFISRIIFLMHSMKLSNIEKINAATTTAEETLNYAVKELPIGIIKYNTINKEVDWLNPYAQHVFQINTTNEEQLSAELIEKYLGLAEKKKDIFKLNDHVYRFSVDATKDIITFEDITKESTLYQEKIKIQTAIGIISIDNYDDITDTMDDKSTSYLNSFTTTLISDWLDNYNVFYKRLNAEKYIFIAQLKDIEQMIEVKFELLDKVRKKSQERNVYLTLSIGISYGGSTLNQTGLVAQSNLDMALVRGGDQVVLKEAKENKKPLFWGGNSASVARRTRVRSRAMSTSLKEIIMNVADIYIMGHKFPDMDAIGAAIGVNCLATFNDKQAWIVLDREQSNPDMKRVIEEIQKYPEINQAIISPKEAINQKTSKSLLVMVDYHKPSLSISQKLYEQFDQVVIIDHHRRGEEFPEKPLLTYIESSASSASELITELIEYQSTKEKKISKLEATFLLSGIVVDTKSFNVRTTARTFDVASYLKTCGADLSLVQYLLGSDLSSYLEINHLVARTEYITKSIVVVAGDEETEYNPILAAKTADTLLSMVGIKATFVITKRIDKKIGISARSDGSVNVQKMMEELGGGGHFTNAAVQLPNQTITRAKQQLIAIIYQAIDEMTKEE